MKQVEAAVIGTGWCGGIRSETLSRSALVDKLHVCEIRPDRLAEVQALTRAALARPTDFALRSLGTFHGFEILSRAKMTASLPDLFIRGEGTYLANLNADNPVGTMQSIEHTLCPRSCGRGRTTAAAKA